MKHSHILPDSVDVNVKVEIPTHDIEDVVICVAGSAIAVIGSYMAFDAARHIIKTVFA